MSYEPMTTKIHFDFTHSKLEFPMLDFNGLQRGQNQTQENNHTAVLQQMLHTAQKLQ